MARSTQSSNNRPDRLMQTKRSKGQKTLADRGRTIVLARKIGRVRAGLVLAQNRDDLLFREPNPLQPSVPLLRSDSNSAWRKNSVAGHSSPTRG